MAKALVIPENIRLHRLPAYSPQLNPQEHLWDEIREKLFPNRVFSDMAGVVHELEQGLPQLAADTDRIRSIAAWPWIVRLNLNARWNETMPRRHSAIAWKSTVGAATWRPQSFLLKFKRSTNCRYRIHTKITSRIFEPRLRCPSPLFPPGGFPRCRCRQFGILGQ